MKQDPIALQYLEQLQGAIYRHLLEWLAQMEGTVSTEPSQQRNLYAATLAEMGTRFQSHETILADSETFTEILQKRLPNARQTEIDDIREDFRRKERATRESLPTKYQNPNLYMILQDHVREIERSSTELFQVTNERPILATLPLGSVNAMTIAPEGTNSKIIAFDDEMFSYINLMAITITAALPIEGCHNDPHGNDIRFHSAEDVESVVQAKKEAIELYAALTHSYLVYGNPSIGAIPFLREHPQLLIPDEPYGRLTSALTSGAELFIMGHEYAHVMLKHLESSPLSTRAMAVGVAREVTHDWQKEFNADGFGFLLMHRAMLRMGWDSALASIGVECLFSCLDTMESAVESVNCREKAEHAQGTHPPARRRRAFLDEVVADRFSGNELRAISGLREIVRRTVDALWASGGQSVLDRFSSGDQLFPTWSNR